MTVIIQGPPLIITRSLRYVALCLLIIVSSWQVEGFCPRHTTSKVTTTWILSPRQPQQRYVEMKVAVLPANRASNNEATSAVEEVECDEEKSHAATTNTKHNVSSFFSIHPVRTRQRALDVMTFRHGKLVPTLTEYYSLQQQQQQQQQPQQPSPPNSLPENDGKHVKKERTVVLEQLTQHTFDNPNLQQFYAILYPTNSSTTTSTSYQTISSTTLLFPTSMPLIDDVSIQRSHGVIGSIDALVVVDVGGGATATAVTQEKAAAVISSSHSYSSSNTDPTTNSATVVTTVELRNLRVHQCARRCGIGKALIQAVQRHTQEDVKSIMRVGGGEAAAAAATTTTRVAGGIVYLEVDSNNVGAIQLYQQMGFVWDAQIADRMNWVCVM
jgi:ribosomal protein S18 acetylase RimI-like enzyme